MIEHEPVVVTAEKIKVVYKLFIKYQAEHSEIPHEILYDALQHANLVSDFCAQFLLRVHPITVMEQNFKGIGMAFNSDQLHHIKKDE